MSAEANKLLITAYSGQYNTQSRGDVIIKVSFGVLPLMKQKSEVMRTYEKRFV